jgi:hypothetical protein
LIDTNPQQQLDHLSAEHREALDSRNADWREIL